MESDDMGSFSWVKRGRQRRAVVMAMTEDEMMPTEISLNTRDYGSRITLSNLSGVLSELLRAKIITSKDKTTAIGRLYSLTQKGKEYRKRLSNSPLFKKEEQHS